MIRVANLDRSIDFYTSIIGLKLVRKTDYPHGKFTLAFLSINSNDDEPFLELTYNWDIEKYELGTAFGHIAIGVDDIYQICDEIKFGWYYNKRTRSNEGSKSIYLLKIQMVIRLSCCKDDIRN